MYLRLCKSLILRSLYIFLLTGVLLMWPFHNSSSAQENPATKDLTSKNLTAYDFSFPPLTGNDDLFLSQFKGKVILVVNTASQCGFTGQYEGLEKLYQTYKDQGLVIIGVPSDDFGHQEPGSNQDIAHFCKTNYGVNFPMASKQNVIGNQAHPFYQWARQHFGLMGAPKWNFHKYLIGRQGQLVDYFYSTTAPDNPKFVDALRHELNHPE